MTVSQHAQNQDPEMQTTKWNSAIVLYFFIYTCAFPIVTC